MELMKTTYFDTLIMPVKRFYNLIKWKTDLEEERNKIIKEQQEKIASAAKQKRR